MEFIGQCRGIFDDLLGVGLELGLQRFAESDGLGSDDVLVRTALDAGEYGRSISVGIFSSVFSGAFSGVETVPLVRIMPPRGPRKVLCVVVVMTWKP